MTTTRVWYHASCYDGFCAALQAYHVFGRTAEYTSVQYNQPVPEYTKDDSIYILDFSYPREVLEKINTTSLVVLDHHKTAPQDLPYCIFDMEKSGAHLAALYFGTDPTHWLVRYTEDRDLWRWALPNSREVNAGLRTYEMDFDVWNNLTYDECLTAGQVLNRYLTLQLNRAINHGRVMWLDNIRGLGAGCTHDDLISDLAGSLAEESGTFGATFFFNEGNFTVSLRSRGELDVSKIASKYGGGGHHNAAGFTCDPNQFLSFWEFGHREVWKSSV